MNGLSIMRLLLSAAVVAYGATAARPLPAQGVFDSWLKPRPSLLQPQSSAPHPSVARIIVKEKDGVAYGSGTLVDARDEHGLVVTNWHVVRDAVGEITVVFSSGFRSAARVLKVDSNWDLAALVIWRPNVPPVPVSTIAPRPGDTLTIAGYGSGTYRAVTGRCTQYVAPGTNQPYEMVELSAQARQGDSGGPIFNERGELAGVLFGASRGTTSGSYAGRVRWFLASLAPNLNEANPALVATPPRQSAAAPPSSVAASAQPKFDTWTSMAPQPQATTPAASFGETASVAGTPSTPMQAPQLPLAAEPTSAPRLPFETAPIPEPAEPSFGAADSGTLWPPATESIDNGAFDVHTLIGNTPLEKAKAVLAAIGLLAVLLQVSRLFGKS